MNKALVAIFALLVGLAIGAMLMQPTVQKAQTEAKKQSATVQEAKRETEKVRLAAAQKIKELEEDKQALRFTIGTLREAWDTVAIPRDILKESEIVLPDRKETPNQPPEVREAMTRILAMTEEERDTANAALARAWRRLRELEAERVKVKERSDTHVTLQVEPFADKGREVRTQLLTALKLALDENRVQTWQLVDKEFPDKLFNHFGQGLFTLTLRQQGGLCAIQEERKVPGRGMRTQGTATKEALRRYARFAKYFPEVIRKQVSTDKPGTPKPQPVKPKAKGNVVF